MNTKLILGETLQENFLMIPVAVDSFLAPLILQL